VKNQDYLKRNNIQKTHNLLFSGCYFLFPYFTFPKLSIDETPLRQVIVFEHKKFVGTFWTSCLLLHRTPSGDVQKKSKITGNNDSSFAQSGLSHFSEWPPTPLLTRLLQLFLGEPSIICFVRDFWGIF